MSDDRPEDGAADEQLNDALSAPEPNEIGEDPEPETEPVVAEVNTAEKARPEVPDNVPRVTVQSKGRVTQMMEQLADLYKAKHPDRDVRYVYSPVHRPDLSNVLTRRAQGYIPVIAQELGTDVPGIKADEDVRVGDVVLMSIERATREAISQELEDLAKEQSSSVERSFYDSIESMGDGVSEEHKPRPRGRSVIEEREFAYDIEQRSS